MNNETARIAERHGITEKCASLERDLLSIDGVTLSLIHIWLWR